MTDRESNRRLDDLLFRARYALMMTTLREIARGHHQPDHLARRILTAIDAPFIPDPATCTIANDRASFAQEDSQHA